MIGDQVRVALGYILIVDPDKHEVAEDLVKVWCLALEALGEQMAQYIPNEEELSEFVSGIRRDIENKDYQLYCNMYIPVWICLKCRYLVTGRKGS